MVDKIAKKDFVELKYTGYVNNEIFDSNIEEDLKKINPNEKARKTVIIVGEGMVVSGLDKAIEGKETGKEYDIELKPSEAFGERKRELMRMVPLKMFHEKQVDPKPGMVFALDNSLAKIIAVSGARVTVDFNNPLASKTVKYKFKIMRKVDDIKEKAEAAFELLIRFVPEFEVKEEVVVKAGKGFEIFVNAIKEKFKELTGKGLTYELKEEKKETENK